MKSLYTSIIGVFVFQDGNLIEEKLFSKDEIRDNYTNLGKGEIKQEKELLEKHPGAKLVGKEGPGKDVLELFAEKKYLEKLREANIIITRKKVALSVQPDHLLIQSVNSIDEMDKIANTMAKRLREWYGLYNPEFSHNIEDHEKFVRLVLTKTKKELLKEVGVEEKASMGAEVAESDLKAMREFAQQVDGLYESRKKQVDYITETMKAQYPNITAIAGAMIAGKLLSIAGSIKRMAMLPASTIQLLGAEKALFRHLKTGAKPPKFGVIINHPLVTKARKSDKGKVARALADKISLATKIDYFKGEFKGDKLRKDLEERFK